MVSWRAETGRSCIRDLGRLVKDPDGLIDLPKDFSYRVISRFRDRMSDGLRVPDRADGMGCFAMPDGRIALVRNHELKISDYDDGPFGKTRGAANQGL